MSGAGLGLWRGYGPRWPLGARGSTLEASLVSVQEMAYCPIRSGQLPLLDPVPGSQ